jgi:hypothetical protein
VRASFGSRESLERGDIVISAGLVELGSSGYVRNNIWSVSPGTSLLLDNSQAASADRIADSARVILNRSTFGITGNSSASVTERIGSIVARGGHGASPELPGSGTIVRIDQLDLAELGAARTGAAAAPAVPGAQLVLRSATLGGAAGGAFTRVVAENISLAANSPIGFGFVPGSTWRKAPRSR